jgi:hypothetical protein
LRVSNSPGPHRPTIEGAIRASLAQGARLCFAPQIPGAFWNASTRPRERDGFGLGTAETGRIARVIEWGFEFLPDSRDMYDRWRRLLVEHAAKGVQVHAASLAAGTCVHGIKQFLTLNVRSSQRFGGSARFAPPK